MRRLAVAAALVVGLALMAAYYYIEPVSSDATPRHFVVQAGDSVDTIGQRLEAAGLIRSAGLFRLAATFYGLEKTPEAGVYELRPNMSIPEILSQLRQGAVLLAVTIPEGWRLEQVATLLEKKGLFPQEDFMAATRAQFPYGFLSQRPAGASLEGYLFPDTYFIAPSASPTQVVDLMLANFDSHFTAQMRAQADRRGLSMHQVATLASIVEREIIRDEERPLIAAVFLKRLTLGMYLNADPTIQYAVGSDPASVARDGFWKAPLSRQDLLVNSPYSTYRYRGLPPGPIASPGLASLVAVVEAPETDYLYFVAKGDGSHVFARTLEEHSQNVARYQGG